METVATLKEQYEALKAEIPKMRIRDAAHNLQVGEAQLVALNVGNGVTKLEGNWSELLKEIQSLGKVMALTRNNDAVHERKGVYNNVSFEGPVGLVLDADIDLRLFMMYWATGFAVTEGDRHSLQFFDKSGEAVHKIYMLEESNMEAYHALVNKYKAAVQTTEVETSPYPAPAAELPDSEIDVAAFQEGWKNIQDTHEFFGLNKKFKLTRTQALRLAPVDFVQQVPNDTTRKMLQVAAERQVPIMVFVGSRGCIQIHSGEVTKLMEAGPWYNVLDPEFNLHLRETQIASTYIVKKPSVDGIVTAIEVFDEKGEMIIQFFGKRKPGIPELETWRDVVKTVSGN
jgi:putative hemin transport protein